jgi:hypothetical protein
MTTENSVGAVPDVKRPSAPGAYREGGEPRPIRALERLERHMAKVCAAERAAESLTESGEVRRKYLWVIRLT